MIAYQDKPLDYYTDLLNRNRPFAFYRFGDGEWSAMLGRLGHNCDHHQYSPALGEDLRRALAYASLSDEAVIGLQPLVLTLMASEVEAALQKFPPIRWVDADVFHVASIEGRLFPLIEILRRSPLVIIGPSYLRKIVNVFPHYEEFIEVPERNCYLDKNRIRDEVLAWGSTKGQRSIYAFSCSMLAEVLISELSSLLPNATLIDFGSLWDPFVSHPTRPYHREMTKATMERNLRKE